MGAFVPVTIDSSPNGRWSALYTTESQWHCTLLGLLNGCIIQTIWQVAKFDRSGKPWRCGLQIITNQLLHTHLHFLFICFSSLLSTFIVPQWKKLTKISASRCSSRALPWTECIQSTPVAPDISRSSPVIWVTLLSDQPRSFHVTLGFVSLLACGGLGLLTLPTWRGCLLCCFLF